MLPVIGTGLPKSTRIAAPQKTVIVLNCELKPDALTPSVIWLGALLNPAGTLARTYVPSAAVFVNWLARKPNETVAPAIGVWSTAFTTVPVIVAPSHTFSTSTITSVVWF